MQTDFHTKEAANAGRGWVLVDADGEVVGRLASKVAGILRGKTKRTFVPHQDCGDFVVVINAEKIRFTGAKLEKKIYRDYSGYIGGLIEERADKLLARKPENILRRAVLGMLPKTALAKNQLKKLKIYVGPEHPHGPQLAHSAKTSA